MRSPLRVVYLGGKQAGCIGLLTLFGADCEVLGVVGYDEHVRRLTQVLQLPLFSSVREQKLQTCLREADLMVCVHGRERVPKTLLDLPRLGGINVHPCLYSYKGASPIERLLKDNNPRASVGVHKMEEEVDRGEVLTEEFVNVSEQRSVVGVYNALYPFYATTLLRVIEQMRQAS